MSLKRGRLYHILLNHNKCTPSSAQPTAITYSPWCCCCVSLFTSTHLGPHHTSRWDRIVMVTGTRALPLSSKSRLQHSSRTRHTNTTTTTTTTPCHGRGQTAVCDMFLMHEVDGSDGGSQPSPREAYTACFPSPHVQSIICVCAEMLWCSEPVRVHIYVRGRSIAFGHYFSRELCSENKLQVRVSL